MGYACAGEDIPQEARDAVAAGFRWRIRCIGSGVGSNPAEELQDELKRTVGYYGGCLLTIWSVCNQRVTGTSTERALLLMTDDRKPD